MKSRSTWVVLASVAALLAGIVSSATASASVTAVAGRTPSGVALSSLVSQTAVSYTPNVYAGSSCGSVCDPSTIYSSAVVNGEVIVAGAFTQACTPASANTGYAQCPGTVTRNYIFAFNPQTGAIDPNFTPALNTGPVYALVAGPNNTVYAGGAFTTVNGTSSPGLVQLSVAPGQGSDGQVVSGFTGQTTGTVYALALNGNALYVGGSYTKVDGTAQKGLARVNATSGALDSSFKFTIGTPISGTSLKVEVMSVTNDGTVLAIGGTFLTVNGLSIPRIALISTGGGIGTTATLENWSSPVLANNCSNEHDYARSLDFSPDGSFFVVATTGYRSAGGASICDAVARFNTAPTGTNVQPVWTDYSGGDSFRSLVVTNTVAYAGGHQRWGNNECGNNAVCEQNAVLTDGLTALDTSTGLTVPFWHPQTKRGVGVQSLTLYPPGAFPGPNGAQGGLIVGTDVNNIGGVTHSKLAMFPVTATTTPPPGGPIQSGMFANGRIGGTDESSAGIAAMCVAAAGSPPAPGSQVVFNNCDDSASQNWTIEPDGSIQLNGLCMDGVTGQAVLNTCVSGTTSQQWVQGPGGTVVNQASGSCLDDPGASTTQGTQLDVVACNGSTQQVWPLPVVQAPPPPPPVGSVYSPQLQSNTDAPCLDDSGYLKTPGNKVELYSCIGSHAEYWTMQANGTFQIKGQCLDTQGEGTAQATQVVINPCNGGPTQVWLPGANRSLVNQASGMCLDDPDFNTTDGIQLQIWSCNGGPNQAWWLPTY